MSCSKSGPTTANGPPTAGPSSSGRLLKAYAGPEFRHVYPNGDEVMVVDIVYWCHGYEGELRLQPEEVTQIRWFPLDALPENLLAHNRIALRDYAALMAGRT